jgi:hypothetical protein
MTAVEVQVPATLLEQARRRARHGIRSVFAARFSQVDAAGRLVWVPGMGDTEDRRGPLPGDPAYTALLAQGWVLNSLADSGEQLMLDATWRQGTRPTTGIFGALFNDTPVDTDTIGTLTGEPAGNGYARLTWANNSTDFPTLALDSGDYKLTGVQKTYTASGGTIGPVTYLCFVSTSSGAGSLYAYMPLAATRTLLAGDSLNVTPALKLG